MVTRIHEFNATITVTLEFSDMNRETARLSLSSFLNQVNHLHGFNHVRVKLDDDNPGEFAEGSWAGHLKSSDKQKTAGKHGDD